MTFRSLPFRCASPPPPPPPPIQRKHTTKTYGVNSRPDYYLLHTPRPHQRVHARHHRRFKNPDPDPHSNARASRVGSRSSSWSWFGFGFGFGFASSSQSRATSRHGTPRVRPPVAPPAFSRSSRRIDEWSHE
jgi:hypothetical protein